MGNSKNGKSPSVAVSHSMHLPFAGHSTLCTVREGESLQGEAHSTALRAVMYTSQLPQMMSFVVV